MLTPLPNLASRSVRVLLVDDDTELGDLVREYLAREDFSLDGMAKYALPPSGTSPKTQPQAFVDRAGGAVALHDVQAHVGHPHQRRSPAHPAPLAKPAASTRPAFRA